MFDNAIFASFIPQILMVLAYISCVIAPNFTKQDNVDVTEASIYEVVVIQSTSNLPSQTISFTEINLISDLYVPKIENRFPNAIYFKKIFPEVVFDISKSLKFFSFLRPPPSF